MHTQTNIFHSLKNGLLISLLVIVLSHSHLFAQEPRLLFKSSFGGTTALDKTGYHELFGSENGYEWPYDVPGDNYRVGDGNAGRYFNYIISDLNNYLPYVDTRIDDVTVPGTTATKALYMETKKDDPNKADMSRNNYAFRAEPTMSDPNDRYDQMYYRYKIKQHFLKTGASWKNVAEMKAAAGDFRWTLYMYDIGGTPYWHVKAQDGTAGSSPEVFSYSNHDVPVPEDEWFDLEIFVVHSTDKSLGKWQLAINGVIVFDITNRTLNASGPRSFWAFKNYGAPGWQWITDFEMWDKPPVTSVLSQEYTQSGSSTETKLASGSFIMSPGVLK